MAVLIASRAVQMAHNLYQGLNHITGDLMLVDQKAIPLDLLIWEHLNTEHHI